MNSSPKLDNDLTSSSPPLSVAMDVPKEDLHTPKTPDPSRQLDATERKVMLPHSNASDNQDSSGQYEEAQGLLLLNGIMFGILIMAIFGAVITLAFVAR